MKIVTLCLLILNSLQVFAGGWTSGGGELIRDAHNPWFMANTKDVTYCIRISENHFGQSKSFVREQVVKAIDFWKVQLKDLTYWKSAAGFSFELGTQIFTEINCNQNPDITFQFAALSAEQKGRLCDVSKTVAVSVRTDYDLINLKGKGFVFVQADNKFSIKPWSRSNGSRILPVLIHELGHIFGIQHSDDIEFMNEDYAEELVDEARVKSVDRFTEFLSRDENYNRLRLFAYHKNFMQSYGLCIISNPISGPINGPIDSPITKPKGPKTFFDKFNSTKALEKFFGIPENDNCQNIVVENNELLVKSGIDKTNLIGKAVLVQKDAQAIIPMYQDGLRPAHFWCPPEQKVFTAASFEVASKITIASFLPKQYFKGIYNSTDGKISRPIGLELTNSGSISKLIGVLDGELIIDLQSNF